MKKGKLGEERQSWGLPTRGLSSLGMWQSRGNLQAQGSEYSSPVSRLYCQCQGHGRHLLHISRRNDCQTQLPSSSPRGWQHHLGSCCDKKHTALASLGLGGAVSLPWRLFLLSGWCQCRKNLHTWTSVPRVTHCHGAASCCHY